MLRKSIHTAKCSSIAITRNLPIENVLRLLDVKFTLTPQPWKVNCPVCKHETGLWVYKVNANHDHWLFCTNCKFSGDHLHLVMAAWHLPLATVVEKLINAGAFIKDPEAQAVESYQNRIAGLFARLKETWQKAQSTILTDSKTLRAIQHKYSLWFDRNKQRWTETTGRFIGGLPCNDIEDAFRPNSIRVGVDEKVRKADRNDGIRALFTGKSWDDTMLVPMYHLPGMFAGFYCLGRFGDLPGDVRVKEIQLTYRTEITGRQRMEMRDVGIAMYSLMEPEAINQFEAIYVIQDVMIAASLHGRHFSTQSYTLPIVGCHTHPGYGTRLAWMNAPKHKYVFWGTSITSELFNQARIVDGFVSTYLRPHSPEADAVELLKSNPPAILNDLNRTAKPWDEALEYYLAHLEHDKAVALLVGLDFSDEQMSRFLSKCDRSVRLTVESILKKKITTRSIVFDGQVISERNNTWFLAKSGDTISDAVVKIDEIVYKPKLQETYYSGRIVNNDIDVAFTANADKLREAPDKWLNQHLLNRYHPPLYWHTGWKHLLVDLALKFHTPVVKHHPDTIGWNDSSASFVLPRITIEAGSGEITSTSLSRTDPSVLPASCFKDDLLPEEDLRLITMDLCKQPITVWAGVLGVLSQVLSPACNRDIPGFGYNKDAQYMMHSIAKIFGCYIQPINKPKKDPKKQNTQVLELTKLCDEFSWPVLVQAEPTNRLISTWLDSDNQKAGIVPRTKQQIWLDAVTGRSLGLISAKQFLLSDDTIRKFRSFILTYLVRFCKANCSLPPKSSFISSVINDVGDFVQAVSGESINRTAIYGLLVDNFSQADKADTLLKLLTYLEISGSVLLIGDEHIKDDTDITDKFIRIRDEYVFVPLISLARAGNSLRLGELRLDTLGEILRVAGYTISDYEYRNLQGWYIKNEIWQRANRMQLVSFN